MNPEAPPVLKRPKRSPISRRGKLLIGIALIPAIFFCAIFGLRECGLIRPFAVPTAAMAPTISAGDHIMMEGLSYRRRQPHRGDIAVFWTGGLPLAQPGTFYAKRIAGEPGERVRIAGGKLYIDEKVVSLTNAAGEIQYNLPLGAEKLASVLDVVVPAGCYYVLGDNATNSSDSRFWGCVPRKNIIGRVSFCYWPPSRVGTVK